MRLSLAIITSILALTVAARRPSRVLASRALLSLRGEHGITPKHHKHHVRAPLLLPSPKERQRPRRPVCFSPVPTAELPR